MVASHELSKENLKVHPELWLKILDASADGIVVLKALRDTSNTIKDFEYVMVNKKAGELLKRNREELLGQTMLSEYPGTMGKGVQEMYAEIVETGISKSYEIYYDTEGFQNWFKVTVAKIEDGITITFDDITEARNARTALFNNNKLLEKIYNGTSDALVLLNPLFNEDEIYDFRYELINTAGELMLSTPRETIIGKTVLELYPGSVKEGIFQLYVKTASEGIPFDVEFFYEHEGLKNFFRQRGVRIDNKILVITSDITDIKQAQEKLTESKNFIEAIADNSPALLYLYNLQEKKIEYINQKVHTYLGYSKEEIFGENFDLMDLIHPDDKIVVSTYYENYREGRVTEPDSLEYRIRHKQGKDIWLRCFNSCFSTDNQGRPLLIIGNAADITEKKVVEDEMQKMKFICDFSSDFIGLVTLDGTAEYLNKEGQRMVGLDNAEEVKKTKIVDYFMEEDREYITRHILPIVVNIGKWSGEINLRNFKTESPIPVTWNVFRISGNSGEPIAIACISQDMTFRKIFEKELIFLNSQLEDKVKKRTYELDQKNMELARINNDLDNFVYTASHDLRAPISNIEGLMNLLIDMINGSYCPKDELMEIVSMVNNSVIKFKRTLQDLAEITKVQKNIENEVTEINVQDTVSDLKRELERIIKNKKAEIIYDAVSCPVIQFSKINFRSILYNLLSNAVIYSDPLKQPVIEIKCEEFNNYILLQVKDNGLGINRENQHKLFSMFKRFHAHVEGTGIGLYIVKRIVDNAGGKIEFESEEGSGTTVKVYLPKGK